MCGRVSKSSRFAAAAAFAVGNASFIMDETDASVGEAGAEAAAAGFSSFGLSTEGSAGVVAVPSAFASANPSANELLKTPLG